MQVLSFNFNARLQTIWQQFQKPVAAVVIALGMGSGFAIASPIAQSVPAIAQNSADVTTAAVRNTAGWADGIYLYGQSPLAEQIGSAYMVFSVDQGQVVGAFYMPQSSFDCFYGSVQDSQLALTVVNSYDEDRYAYSLPLQENTQIAGENPIIEPMGIEGFHPISSVSENDHRILGVCQTSYGDTF